MYNEKRKKEFFEYKTKHTSYDYCYVSKSFERTEKFENELGRDVCNFSITEIQDMYKRLNFAYQNSILKFNSLMVSYTDWCFMNGYVNDSQNHFRELDYNMLSEYVNKYVVTSKVVDRDDVEEWCNNVPNYIDKFLLLGIFEGISGENFIEITELKDCDIDIANHRMKIYERGWLEFSEELCLYALQSSQAFTYESIRSDAFKSVPLEDTPNVFKSRKTSKIQNSQFRKGRRVYTRLRMVFKYLGIDDFFMATDLKNSGMIYYVNKKASETGVSGKDYLFTNMDEINKRFNRSLRAKNFYDQYGDFLV